MKREEEINSAADAETLIGFHRGEKVLKAKVGEKGPVVWIPFPWEPVPDDLPDPE